MENVEYSAEYHRPEVRWIYTVSQKKTSHFNFWHNFAICWDIFTIFEARCSALIAGWYNLLHTHHRCEAFTWRDVTRRHSSSCTQCALVPDFIPPDLWCLNSPDLNPADHSFWSIMQKKVYQTHIANIDELKHRLVQTWAEWTTDISLQLSDSGDAVTPSQCVLLVCESSGGDIWTNICVEFTCSRLGYLLNSWPM